MPTKTPSQTDPKQLHEKPPFHEARIPTPGRESEMNTKPDHGEETYRGLGRLENKMALITGGDSGIGRAVAIAFAREGADVGISYLPEEQDDANATADWVRQAGRECLLFPGDISGEQHCRQMIDDVFKQARRLDILVNNAAYQMTHKKLEEFSSEEWDHTFRTNIYAMFYLSQSAIPRMNQGGAIINTASVQAYEPNGNLLAYATTKGAIVTFTKALSELALENGIRVNAVAPGPVWTPLIPSTMPDEKVKHFGQKDPMKRPAQPAELAPAYVYLACNESTYVTGSVMDLTGGRMLP